jgi:hypothetical protein
MTYQIGRLSARMDAIEAREARLDVRQDALDQRERGLGVIATQIADLAGRASVIWDRIERARADAMEEPLAAPPGTPSKEPEPSLALEGDAIAGTSPGEPSDHPTKEDQEFEGDPRGEFLRLKHPVTSDQREFPTGELPTPPVVQQPIAAGLDKE